MSKLRREQTIERYKKRKQGERLASLSQTYFIRKNNIHYLVSLINKHGNDVLREDKNNKADSGVGIYLGD